MIGVEPTCLAAPDPKSGASANFATSADCIQDFGMAKVRLLKKYIKHFKELPLSKNL